ESRPPGALPEQLYLLLDGRGLDGRGMPVQVIDDAVVVGSGRQCTVWVNSPRIETRHLQFVREGAGWYVEDLGSAHGTFFVPARGSAPLRAASAPGECARERASSARAFS